MYLSYLLIDTAADPARPRPGRAWVRNPYRVHQRLCMAFPSADRRERERKENLLSPFAPADFEPHVHTRRAAEAGFLFRIDMVGEPWWAAGERAAEWRGGLGLAPASRHVIVVQSAIAPDWQYAFHNAREFLCAEPLVRAYNPAFAAGQKYRFVLRANPTKKVGTAPKAERLAAKGAGVLLAGRHGRRVFLHDPAEQESWLRTQGQGDQQRESKGFRVIAACAESEGPARGRRDDEPITLASVRFEGTLEVTKPAAFRAAVFAGIGPGKGFGFGLLSLAPVGG